MWVQPAIMERPPEGSARNSSLAENLWEERNGALFPEDLRDWIDERNLAEMASATCRESWKDGPFAGLAKLLTYYYAAGIYSSEEIALQGRSGWRESSDSVEILCGPDLVDRIRQFRRRHRALITNYLRQILTRSWSEHELWPAKREMPDFASEAERRINEAVRQDCWASDC